MKRQRLDVKPSQRDPEQHYLALRAKLGSRTRLELLEQTVYHLNLWSHEPQNVPSIESHLDLEARVEALERALLRGKR